MVSCPDRVGVRGTETWMWETLDMSSIKPILRWAGSKKKLLPVIHAALPNGLDLTRSRLFEPFFGSGALTFSFCGLPRYEDQVEKCVGRPFVANDVNSELMTLYKVLNTDLHALVERLGEMASDVSEESYYKWRDWNPATDVEIAARMVYLNRTGFNGLYRVNGKGRYNVPYGRLSKPKICVREEFEAVAQWLKHVELKNVDFEDAVSDAKEGDLVYLDPPYIPLSTTASFSKYSKNDFGHEDQVKLGKLIDRLSSRGVYVILSNSDTDLTSQIFSSSLPTWIQVPTRRSIAAKPDSRGVVTEILATNYEIDKFADPEMIRDLQATTTGANQ